MERDATAEKKAKRKSPWHGLLVSSASGPSDGIAPVAY
jgi:hypothetical protein